MNPRRRQSPATAAIYCRISKDRTGAGLGVDRQARACQEWADDHGWKVAEVYSDDDMSAYSGKPRPAYKRMLEDIAESRRDGLIAWHNDRLTRHPRELEELVEVIERSGVPIGTVSAGNFDLSNPSGRGIARILGSVARMEAEHTAERLQLKHLELAEQGRPAGGGTRPFGFEDDKITIRRPEAKLIKEAATRILTGETLRAVSADWNERGVSTVSGVRWEPTTLKRMLVQPRLSGQREHHGRIVGPAVWKPILTPEQTTRLRAILEDDGRGIRDRAGSTYLLAGLVYCCACGARMICRPAHRKNGTKFRRYYCSVDRGGCNKVGISAERTEEFVVEQMHTRHVGPKSKAGGEHVNADKAAEKLAKLEERKRLLNEMLGVGEMTREEYGTARDRLLKEITEARRQVEDALAAGSTVEVHGVRINVAAQAASLREDWETLTTEQRRDVVRRRVEGVTIAPAKKWGVFDAGRVTITWR
jgi:DNA invertase Pin-like site-specific DNA recombinase